MPKRIITAVDTDGWSVIADNGLAPVHAPAPGLELAEQWCGPAGPDALTSAVLISTDFALVPPPGGVLFRLVSFPPDPDGQMHRTETVDLLTLVDGELVLALDSGEEVTLQPGDTVVQQAATHAWRNLTDRPALAAIVLVSTVST